MFCFSVLQISFLPCIAFVRFLYTQPCVRPYHWFPVVSSIFHFMVKTKHGYIQRALNVKVLGCSWEQGKPKGVPPSPAPQHCAGWGDWGTHPSTSSAKVGSSLFCFSAEYVCLCVCMRENQWPMMDVSLHLILRQHLSLTPELTVLGILLPLPPQ